MIAKNIAYLYIIQALRLCLPLAMLSVLTDVLNGPQYSIYVYTLANATWLSIFVEYGFNVSATRRISTTTEPHSTREVIRQTQAARWLLSGATLLFLAWAARWSSVFEGHLEWALCAWLLGVMMGMTPTYYFQAISRLHIVALLEVGGGVATFAAVLLLVREPEDFWRLCVLLLLVRTAIWRAMDREMFSDLQLRMSETFATHAGLIALKDGWRIFLVQAAASLYTSFNLVLLGGVSTEYAVAVYGSAERLIRAAASFIGQTTSAIFPRLNAMRLSNPHKLANFRHLSLLSFATGGTLCVPIVWGLAPMISETLFHGKFVELVTVLRIMAWVIPAIAISNVLSIHFLVVDNMERVVNWVVFSAVPFSLTAGIVLAHKYGAEGMAAAWVIVEWFVAICLAVRVYRHRITS